MKRPLAHTRDNHIAALDVGSSKICCFIAAIDRGDTPKVIGIGHQASQGVKGGAVVDMDAAQGAILNAVHAAEQMAGETIDRVVVNLSGGYPASFSLGVEVSIAGHEVGDGDLRRVLAHGCESESVSGETARGRQLIHSIPVAYAIDGSSGIRDPRGMYGERLGVNMHLITAGSGPVRNLRSCIERCHLDVSGFVVSPFASGLASLAPDEMELGATVVDMGGGTTTIAVFLGGNVIFTDVLPVGGAHVTNDIARGLSTPIVEAERMKTLFGHAVATVADEREYVDVPQVGEERDAEPQQVPRSLLVGIIQPRCEEIFELIRSRLEASGFDKLAGRRVVLTGGASQLPGLRDLAALVLDKQVRVGRPAGTRGLAEATAGPAFATCAGLVAYAIASKNSLQAPTGVEAQVQREESGGLVGRLGDWFREHF
jgi:cell division protein FtsA